MKIKELVNESSYGTSVTSVGDLEYTPHQNKIDLYKKDKKVATIRRESKKGWRFKKTKEWDEEGLPHFGHAEGRDVGKRGRKTVSNNIETILKDYGIRYDSVKERKLDEQKPEKEEKTV